MTFYGDDVEDWSFYAHVTLSCIMLILFFPALFYAFHLKDCSLFLTPILCLFMAYENIILSTGDTLVNGELKKMNLIEILGLSLHVCIIPMFLYICFETGYMVHKNRSVRFCGIYFDEGHRLDTEPCSWFLRNIIRIIALILATVGMVVNFEFLAIEDEDAGSTGLMGLRIPETGIHVWASLLPPLILGIVSLYIGIQFWRYGSHSAMMVHATHCNAWSCMVIGSICFLMGQIPDKDYYPFTSNAGETTFMLCLILAFREIRKDLLIAESFNDFLDRQNHPSMYQEVPRMKSNDSYNVQQQQQQQQQQIPQQQNIINNSNHQHQQPGAFSSNSNNEVEFTDIVIEDKMKDDKEKEYIIENDNNDKNTTAIVVVKETMTLEEHII